MVTLCQHPHESDHLLIDRQAPMVVAPDVLGQIERQPSLADAAFGGQPALQVAPEALQAVDVAAVSIAELALPMRHQAMDVAVGRNPRVARPGVRADDRPAVDSSSEQGQECLGRHVRDDLRPHLAPARQRIPQTGVLDVPRPRFVPICRWARRRLRHAPPR